MEDLRVAFTGSCEDSNSIKKVQAEVDSRLKQQEEVDALVKAVEETANKFSPRFARYTSSSCTKTCVPRERSRKPAIVPRVFYAMWRLLLAPEETYQPKPLTVPVPFPVVDWQALARPNWKDRIGLPNPVALPIHSCSQDPAFYQPSYGTRTNERGFPVQEKAVFEVQFPFGWISGYNTSMGPVKKPSIPINGYILGEDDQWTIAAYPPGGTPGTRRGRR